VASPAGVLYGAASAGGACSQSAAGCGLVYELAPPAAAGEAWTFAVLPGGDGEGPYGPLLQSSDGNLYGTTEFGGQGVCSSDDGVVGCGTVFELSPPQPPAENWMERVLYSFTGQNGDGANPTGSLAIDANGALYGTTYTAGGSPNCQPLWGGESPGCGTVFQLAPPSAPGGAWTETVLYAFAGVSKATGTADGALPLGGAAVDPNGTVYGTTLYGGNGGCAKFADFPPGCGTVFAIAPPLAPGGTWVESILHQFSGFDGAYPYDPVAVGANGVLYGTTQGGRSKAGTQYGTAFQIVLQ